MTRQQHQLCVETPPHPIPWEHAPELFLSQEHLCRPGYAHEDEPQSLAEDVVPPKGRRVGPDESQPGGRPLGVAVGAGFDGVVALEVGGPVVGLDHLVEEEERRAGREGGGHGRRVQDEDQEGR